MRPPTPLIIAAETSFEAMIVYSGEVEPCIMYDSLKRACGTGLRPSRTLISDDCEIAASSLCVEVVVKMVGLSRG